MAVQLGDATVFVSLVDIYFYETLNSDTDVDIAPS